MSVLGYRILRRATISTPRGERHRQRRLLLEALEDRALLTSTLTEFPLSSGAGANAPELLGPVTRLTQTDSADLSLAVAISSPNLYWGDTLTYKLTITNTGPSDATHVVATLKLPSIVAYSGPNFFDGFVYDSTTNTVTYTLDSLAAGTSANATVQGYTTNKGTEPSADHPLPDASVTSDVADPNPQNNSAPLPVLTVTQAGADLSITGHVSDNAVRVGQKLTYAIQVTNHGPLVGANVKVTETLPSGVEYDGPRDGTGGFAYDPATRIVTYTKSYLPASETPLDLSIPVHATAAGIIPAAMASVSNDDDDSNTNNNVVRFPAVLATAASTAELHLSMTASSTKVVTGDTVTYTITVTNTGKDPAGGVQVVDRLPTGFVFVSGDPKRNGSFGTHLVGNTVVSDLGTLDAGATLHVRITLRAKAGVPHHTSGGKIENNATATSGTANDASAAVSTIVVANLMPPNQVGKDTEAAIKDATPQTLGKGLLKLTLGSTSLDSLSAEGVKKTLSGTATIVYKSPLKITGTITFSTPYSSPKSSDVKVDLKIGKGLEKFLRPADQATVESEVRAAVLALVKKEKARIVKALN